MDDEKEGGPEVGTTGMTDKNLPEIGESGGAAHRAAGSAARPSTSVLGFARRVPPWVWLAGLGLAAAGFVAWLGTGYAYLPLAAQQPISANVRGDEATGTGTHERLLAENERLDARLARLAPQGVYIVVDQTENRLYVKQGDRVLLAAICSSGSGMVLQQEGTNRRWVFDTPRGRFTVRSKLTNPVWRRPDWAFVEENQPVPRDPAERLEYGSLGEYALYLGDGYMIHGTLYERLLGRSVTHGCIRLGRDDLRVVYRVVPVGAQVFIY
jgi:L,D-transpeptidase YbiS